MQTRAARLFYVRWETMRIFAERRRLCKTGGGKGRGRWSYYKLAEFLTQAGIKIKRHEKPLLKSAVYLRLEIVDRTIDIGSYIRDL